MILELAATSRKTIASLMLALLYFETIIPSYALGSSMTPGSYNIPPVSVKASPVPVTFVPKTTAGVSLKPKAADLGGPTQPESQAFHSVNNDNMVDLFSGDFSYNIPLMDVGGYPIALGYNSGISMDQEASWVGLGWNINPGTITRNLRGLPDDFNGTDTIQKIAAIKANKTIGVTVTANAEMTGLPLGLNASVGIVNNSYKGWGIESGLNTSINVGSSSMGNLSAGLSFTNSSQDGLTVGGSLDYAMSKSNESETKVTTGTVGVGSSFNSRSGMKALQIYAGLEQYKTQAKLNFGSPSKPITVTTERSDPASKNQALFSSQISFSSPTYTPSVTLPYTSTLYTFNLKTGGAVKIFHANGSLGGYVAKQEIKEADQRMALPAFGYLNSQNAKGNTGVLLDFNREKEIPYREKPAVPNIAIPAYTYDVFAMSGEGVGGMFRAYRGDIGFVHDHYMRTKDNSLGVGLDLGAGDVTHAGVDLGITRSYTEGGPWTNLNPLAKTLAYKPSSGTFEASYFRNPGEMAVNDKTFYNTIGGDDVVAVALNQAGNSDPNISTTHILNRYKNKKLSGQQTLTPRNVTKATRDKRTQVISYLTASEASTAGLSKYIENYRENQFGINNCSVVIPEDIDGVGVGLKGEFFIAKKFENKLFEKIDTVINIGSGADMNRGAPVGSPVLNTGFSARWTGRLKADITGTYKLYARSDDGVRLYLNDTLVIDRWNVHSDKVGNDSVAVNLVAGQFYNIVLEYFNQKGDIRLRLEWRNDLQPVRTRIPTSNLYLMPSKDTLEGTTLSREKRVNDFRKGNHISEIDVLNKDGRRYVYGIPVYNFKQQEASFSVDAAKGNVTNGLVKYVPGTDNTVRNQLGGDHYFNSELMPAYAHSFLLTGILSADYQDLTGDGITPDDPGDAIKFNYTKIAGVKNPYPWRVPATDSANYNEGLKTDNRDDKGSYVYGEKELWYLNSIESKNMIATFKMSNRKDMAAIDENGIRQGGKITRKLDEINLYNKADFNKANRKPVKTVHFEYSYELCMGANGVVSDSGKLTLKKVWFTYNGNNKGERNPYVFNYNKTNPVYNAKSYDRWGNYKPAIQNPGSTANNVILNGDYPYSLQDSTLAAQNAAAWTLDSIVLPSGGRIKIDYESDDYGYVQNKRAAQMFSVAGFSVSEPSALNNLSNNLYGAVDYQYISINVPKAVSSNKEVYTRYLEGMEKLYFRMFVNMPSDKFGSGGEYVPCYATLDEGRYGFYNNGNTIWVRIKAISTKGQTDMGTSIYSPLATAAVQYMRQNLPSKAYPGSDVGDDLSLEDGVKVLLSQADNVMTAMVSFDRVARIKNWARSVDLTRTYIRLNNPFYKKLGGGLRVKKVRIYDHWDAMTKQRESVYGQEYQYTTTKNINGIEQTISSGVASYEPMLGGEENPFRVPIEYDQQVAPLAPTSLGYTEEPLGEFLFPSPSVGYSKVRVNSIHAKNIRSVNGFEESCFYTSYDFPTLVDATLLADGKKRFRPSLTNFLKINVRHFIGLSQGFKIELNDMNGRLKSQASYAATDDKKPVTYTENYYHVDNQHAEFKHLDNIVRTIDAQGNVDTTTTIGEDIELMMDMCEQHSVTTASNLNVNVDFFTFAWPPFWLIPALLSLYHREETRYNSVATTKVINRHGILDSSLTIDKGSKVTAANLLYDRETGNVVLTSTKNEFEDPLYNFNWSAAWAYDGMSGAYKNINVVLDHIYINQGRITNGPSVADYFAAGDEILIGSKQKTGGEDCKPDIATFRAPGMMYVVDANAITGGTPDLYFIDREGAPFTGNDISLKIIRSGRRNIEASVGEATLVANPLVPAAGGYKLSIDTTKVLSAGAVEFKQVWKVADKMKAGKVLSCVATGYPAYAGADEPGCGESGTTYGNMAISKAFNSTNCYAGYPVLYRVPAGKYSSAISQADANTKAWQEVSDSGQAFANLHSRCRTIYVSDSISAAFRRSNCAGGTGSFVVYKLPAGTDTSIISRDDANAKALIRLNAGGPAYANTNGTCKYGSAAVSGVFRKSDCGTGGAGSYVVYSLPAGYDSSAISVADATAQANAHLTTLGNAYANANGTCKYGSSAVSGVFRRSNCGTGGVGSYVAYSLPAGYDSSTVSVADATAQANAHLTTLGNANANTNGTCKYGSTAVSGVFRKSDCGTGGAGSYVVYSLPAGYDSSAISVADATAQANAHLTTLGNASANTNGTCKYGSTAVSGTFTRSNCGTGGVGSLVPYSLPAGYDSSTISVADATAQANAHLTTLGNANANTNGTCKYGSAAVSGVFRRSNCGTGGAGSYVAYSLPAGYDSSSISVADATAQANAHLTTLGNAYANTNGTCKYGSTAVSGTFTRSNCGTGGVGSLVPYSLPAGYDSSAISVADATAQANAHLTTLGNANANTNGTCKYGSAAVSGTFTRSNCGTGGVGSLVPYSLPAGYDSSAISVADATALANSHLTTLGNANANTNGICKYYSDAMTGSFTRTGCTSPFIGSSVSYTLPANYDSSTISKADANAKATAHFNTLGQANAQTSGTCVHGPIPFVIEARTGMQTIPSTTTVTIVVKSGTTVLLTKSVNGTVNALPYTSTVPYATTYTVEITATASGAYAAINNGNSTSLGTTTRSFTVRGIDESITVDLWKQ